jgi:hypothetical protein
MGKPVSGLTAAQVVAKSELVTQSMKEPKMTMKKQPFWVWKCNWRGPKNKPCDKGVDKKGKPNKKPMVIEGRNYAVVLRTSEGHWNFTHLKEAQAPQVEVTFSPVQGRIRKKVT